MARTAQARYVGRVSTAVIKTDGLTKRFPRITALDRLTVEVHPGVVGLVGANGAGKSTLIKILLGLAPATSGTGRVLGLDIATQGPEIRERVGYMPEHDCLPPDVSATEFVVHMARMTGLPAAAARERTADTLRHVGLYEERYRPMGGYSTGMKQRVKLAQALVHDPKLVLLDEPTNGLDPVGRDEMLALIRRVHRDFGISVLVTTHLLGELERTCDHLVVIDGGKLLRSSSTASFTEATALLAVEVTGPPVAHQHPCPDSSAAHPLLEDPALEDPALDPVAAVRERLIAAGLSVTPDGSRVLLVRLAGDDTYDTIRDTVADLGLGLVRLEQRRHRVAELFTDTGQTADTADTADADGPESQGGPEDAS
ncbi:ABC transporter ATP-binding protein [Kitasatospora sp. NPDC001660]